MREEVRDGIEGLDGTFGATGQVDDDVVANSGDTTGKQSGRRFLGPLTANFFRDAGNEAIGSVACGFGSCIARAKARAAGGEKKFGETGISDRMQLAADFLWIVGTLKYGRYVPAELTASFHKRRAGQVLAFSASDGITDGKNGHAHGWVQPVPTVSRLASSIRRMASIKRPVVLRVVVVALEALAALKSISNSPSVQRTTLKTASSPVTLPIFASRHWPLEK